MITVVRLYRQHDMDLMTLYFNKSVSLGRLLKRVLVSYVNGSDIEPFDFGEPELTEGYIPRCVCIHLHLNENKPEELAVCNLLTQMKSGYRCSFVKALFRNYCVYLPMVGYTKDSAFKMRKVHPIISFTQEATEKQTKTETETKTETVEGQTKTVSTEEDVVATEPVKSVEVEPIMQENPSNEGDLDSLFASFDKIG